MWCVRCAPGSSGEWEIRKRHKCVAERRKPVWEQCGAVQCGECLAWFQSRRGLAVHRCRPGT